MKTYDFKKVQLIFGGSIITGYAEDSVITVRRNSDMWEQTIGADGEGTRSKSNDKSGQVEIKLKQSSISNDDLSAMSLADETSNSGVAPLMLKDGSGRSLTVGEQFWVKKLPDQEFGKTAGDRVWILETDNLNALVAGN